MSVVYCLHHLVAYFVCLLFGTERVGSSYLLPPAVAVNNTGECGQSEPEESCEPENQNKELNDDKTLCTAEVYFPLHIIMSLLKIIDQKKLERENMSVFYLQLGSKEK